MEAVTTHPICKVPILADAEALRFEPCGVLACFLLVWRDRDEATNLCEAHARHQARKYEPLVTAFKTCRCPAVVQ